MIVSISTQAVFFLAAALAGALLGVFYDVFRLVRRFLRHKTAVVAIEDALFWLLSTAFVFIFLLRLNFGELRGFTFIGLGLGTFIYFLLISPFFIKLATIIISAVFRPVKKTLKFGQKSVKIVYQSVRRRMPRGKQKQSDNEN